MDLYAFGFGVCATLALELVGLVAYAWRAERARQQQIKQVAAILVAAQKAGGPATLTDLGGGVH